MSYRKNAPQEQEEKKPMRSTMKNYIASTVTAGVSCFISLELFSADHVRLVPVRNALMASLVMSVMTFFFYAFSIVEGLDVKDLYEKSFNRYLFFSSDFFCACPLLLLLLLHHERPDLCRPPRTRIVVFIGRAVDVLPHSFPAHLERLLTLFKTCDHCSSSRASGHLEEALNCGYCEGRGIVKDPESFVCNMCGGKLVGSMNLLGLPDCKVSGAYDSTHLEDTMSYRFSMCEKCLKDMFDRFAIPPAVSSYMGAGYESYQEIEDAKKKREWFKSGAMQKLSTGFCNATEECAGKAEFFLVDHGRFSGKGFCSGCVESKRRKGSDGWIDSWISMKIEGGDMPILSKDWTALLAERYIVRMIKIGEYSKEDLCVERFPDDILFQAMGVEKNQEDGGSCSIRLVYAPYLFDMTSESMPDTLLDRVDGRGLLGEEKARMPIRGFGTVILCIPYDTNDHDGRDEGSIRFEEWARSLCKSTGVPVKIVGPLKGLR